MVPPEEMELKCPVKGIVDRLSNLPWDKPSFNPQKILREVMLIGKTSNMVQRVSENL